MTTMTMTPPAICCPSNTSNWAIRTVHTIWVWMTHWNQRRRDIEHLRSMSDHHLKDINVRRSDIPSIVYGEATDRIQMLGLIRRGF